MITRAALAMGCIAMLLARPLDAAQAPVVLTEVEPAVVAVGEPVTLRVSVYVPTWFPRPPEWPDFELPNTITRLPPDSSGPVTQRVDRSTWSGIQRRYQIYPLLGGRFEIGDRSMRVTFADPESRGPITVDVPVPLVTFEGQVPDGADVLDPYLAGSMFELEQDIAGDTLGLEAGDALVVRYRATLSGLPSMFLPPLFVAADQPGLSVYAAEPEFTDGDGEAERVEKVTFVFEGPGDYQLPAVALNWWNLQTQTLEAADIPALTLQVGGEIPAAVGVDEAVPLWRVVAAVAGWVAGLVALWMLARRPAARLAAWRREVRARRLASEPHEFDELCRVLLAGGARESYERLLPWFDRLGSPLELDQFCERYGEEGLSDRVTALRRRLYSGEENDADLAELPGLLRRARSRLFDEETRSARSALPALNP